MQQLLVDSLDVRLSLMEGASAPGRVRVQGEFARCDTPTQNGRSYPRGLWESQIKRLTSQLEGKKLFGELDHPCLCESDFSVLAVTGWKPFTSVVVGDQVWSRKDGKAVLSTVEAITNQPYEGPAFSVTGRGLRTKVTPNHKFLLIKRLDSGMNSEEFATIAEIAADRAKYVNDGIPTSAGFFSENADVADSGFIRLDPRVLAIEPGHHAGNIYCLSVTHGNFYMEQNGHSFWTGNSDGKTLLNRVSHVITSLEISPSGKVVGEAEILDTDRGKNLKEILKAGCKVGISSRGYGSTKTNESGHEVVQNDYRLVTFDMVADPADGTAYPEPVFEGVEFPMTTEDQKAADQEMAKRFASELLKSQTTDTTNRNIREEFQEAILARIGEMKVQVAEEVRGELLSDPNVAGALTALESIKGILRPYLIPKDALTVVEQRDVEIARLRRELAEKDLKLQGIQEEFRQLEDVAREVGYKYFLEGKLLAGNPDAREIISRVGDLKQYSSHELVKAKVSSIGESLERARREEKRVASAQNKVTDGLREDVDKLSTALEKSLNVNKQLGIQLYAERKLVNHPKSLKIRAMLEEATPGSTAEVDAIIEQFAPSQSSAEEVETTRSRVRKLTGGGHGSTPQLEETRRPLREDENYQGLGVDLSTLRKMAGISRQDR